MTKKSDKIRDPNAKQDKKLRFSYFRGHDQTVSPEVHKTHIIFSIG